MFEVEAQPVSPAERFAVRFGTTFAANVVRAGLSFLSGLIIARSLGASAYGDLNFLLVSFAAISQLLEMGTSSAFFTFVSRRPRGPKFFFIYGGWMVFQFVATVLVVGLLFPRGVIERVWVGNERGIVLLAFAASFLMTQAWGTVSQLGEAARKTVIVQLASVTQAAIHLVLIAAAAHLRLLSVQSVMWLLVAEFAFLVVVLGPRVVRVNCISSAEHVDDTRAVVKEFVTYCTPLVVFGWVGFLYTFADRWLLQYFGGSEQQGFFAIGQQFANISLIATASILRVFWKEIAEARERQDHQRVQKLYVSASRGLYFAGAWMSCLLIPYSREILYWTVGSGYEAALLPLSLMFLYPIHQSLGQIVGAFQYASGETVRYAKIGLLMMGVSIPVTYLMLASPSAAVPGLGLAAVGLALKLVVLQIIGVNIHCRLIARTNKWTHDYGLQAAVLIALVSLGWSCKWSAGQALSLAGLFHGYEFGAMILGGGLYAFLSLALLYRSPWLAGLTTNQIQFAVSSAARKLRLV